MEFPPPPIRRLLDRLDAAQRRWRPSAFVIGVVKRYGDDRGGMYSALITFYGLLSVFPLLLLFVTIASKVLGSNSEAEKRLVDSALSQFPVIGTQLASNIHALSRGSWLTFVASSLFLLWGALGITSALQAASHKMWRRPRHEEPNILVRSARGLLLLGVLAAAVVLTTVLAGFSASGYLRSLPTLLGLAVLVGQLAINVGAYFLALRILAPEVPGWKQILPGTLVGGIGWTALQQLGGYLVAHQLHRTSEIYGFFAIVLGLIFWLNLGAQLFLYSTEINIVSAEHAWPRGLFEPSDEVRAELEAREEEGTQSPSGAEN